MAFRVEVTPQAEQDADTILEWPLSQHAGVSRSPILSYQEERRNPALSHFHTGVFPLWKKFSRGALAAPLDPLAALKNKCPAIICSSSR